MSSMALLVLIKRAVAWCSRWGREPLELFFELTQDPFWITSPGGRIRRVNAAFTTTLGYAQEEVQCCNILDLVHAEDRELTVDGNPLREPRHGFGALMASTNGWRSLG